MDTNPEDIQGSDGLDDAIDVSTATVDELLGEYQSLTTEIDALAGEPDTLETRTARNTLKIARNQIAVAINTLRATPEVADEPVVEATPVAETVEEPAAETDTPEATDTVETPEVDVTPAAEADTPEVVAEAAPEPEAPAVEEEPIETPEVVAEVTDEPAASTETAEEPDTTTPVAEATETDPPAADTAITDHGVADTATTITTEDFTVDTPQHDTGSNELPSDAAAIVDAAEAILEGAELVGAHTASTGRPIASPDTAPARPSVGWRAGGGQSLFSQDTPLTYGQIGEAMQSVKSRRPSPNGGSLSGVIASLGDFDSTPDLGVTVLSTRRTAEQNTADINETVEAWRQAREGKLARTAAICAPLDILRDIPRCGVVSTPVADLFPQRPISRLGFQYIPQMELADTNDGVAIWTQSDQDAIVDDDSSTWKPVVDIECADPILVRAEEITVGARVDNSTEMSQPEHVEEFMHKLAVQRARRREQYILGELDSLSSAYTYTANYGALSGLLDAVNSLLPRLTYGERLDEGDYDLVLEPGHMQKLFNDENSRVYGDTTASRKAEILAKLKDECGVSRIVVSRDFRTGGFTYGALNPAGDAADALPTLQDANRIRLVPSSAFLYGATGEQATGWQTDPQLVRQNRTQWFSTEWILLAKHGCHPAAYIDVLACGNGSRAAGIAPVNCVGQAS